MHRFGHSNCAAAEQQLVTVAQHQPLAFERALFHTTLFASFPLDQVLIELENWWVQTEKIKVCPVSHLRIETKGNDRIKLKIDIVDAITSNRPGFDAIKYLRGK